MNKSIDLVLAPLAQAIPFMSDTEKEKLMSYGEGVHFMVEQQKRVAQSSQQQDAS